MRNSRKKVVRRKKCRLNQRFTDVPDKVHQRPSSQIRIAFSCTVSFSSAACYCGIAVQTAGLEVF